MPVGNDTNLYWPSPSVTTVRTFSIRAGLAASTLTPGSTAPDVSLTTPAIPLARLLSRRSRGQEQRAREENAGLLDHTWVPPHRGSSAAATSPFAGEMLPLTRNYKRTAEDRRDEAPVPRAIWFALGF